MTINWVREANLPGCVAKILVLPRMSKIPNWSDAQFLALSICSRYASPKPLLKKFPNSRSLLFWGGGRHKKLQTKLLFPENAHSLKTLNNFSNPYNKAASHESNQFVWPCGFINDFALLHLLSCGNHYSKRSSGKL